MRTRFWIHSTILVAASAIAAATSVPHAEAQQFSPWLAPVNLNNMSLSDGTVCPAVVNSTSPDRNDTHPALSKDGLSLYFSSTRSGGLGNYDLWVTHRHSLDACWGPPVNVAAVNSPQQDVAPNLSPDGHWLYFHSKRTGGCGGGVVNELYASYRADEHDDFGWGPPTNLGCATATPPGPNDVKDSATGKDTDSAGPSFFEDSSGNLYLYFTRNTFPMDQQGFHIYLSTCGADVYTCNTQGLWNQGIPVTALNSAFRDTRTALRRDGLEMILSSGRPDNLLSENLWVSTRPSVALDQGNWFPPEPVNCDNHAGCSPWNPEGPLVNSAAFDGGPALSWDGTELYFFRVDPANAVTPNAVTCTVPTGAPDPDTSPYCRDLFVSKRTILIGFPTTTTLSSSTNPSLFGQSVTFTATVSSKTGDTPTGTATFSDGPTNLGTVALTSGEASFTTSSLSIGSHSITAQYNPGRSFGDSEGGLTQDVEYGTWPLYDQTRSVHSGATFPIKLQLCDANGNDLSSSAILVHATSVTAVSGYSGTPDAPGNANPDNDFRFDATLGSTGGYIFNLSTGGLASGTYSLQFTAGSDPVTHSVNFGVN